ncbi:DsbE family thiol:disulfide interchange protein [Tropicimonas sp. S265A]|uniref:DsbE family thiol:disulfide interchange protein n=1 Tax=Tropicimonas sp. S265A TaxID=3415134 RepID=UPI003C7BD00A
MKRILLFLPVAIVGVLFGFFYWGLNPDRDPNAIPSVLISQPAPQFDLPAVEGTATPGLSVADIKSAGEPVLVNVFASWCVPCRAEHVVLTRLVEQDGVRLMGINYKDKPADAAAWLDELGNPYERIGSDFSGRVGIEWGLSGVPETFVIDTNGTVVYRYVGPIVDTGAVDDIKTALQQARAQAGGGV